MHEDGASEFDRRKHIHDSYEPMGREVPPEYTLEVPPLDHTRQYLFKWYYRLSARRRQAMHGLHPLVVSDIGYWNELSGKDMTPFEFEAICRIDDVQRSVINKFLAERDKKAKAEAERNAARSRGKKR